MKKILVGVSILCMGVSLVSCKKDKGGDDGPKIVFKFQFDSSQARLNNLGQPASIPSGHAAQSPNFRKMSAHYVELAPTAFTALGTGAVLYKAAEVNVSGGQFNTAIDHDKCQQTANGETFFSTSIKIVPAGTYEWLRVSLAYQNYDIKYAFTNPLNTNETLYATGTLASFIGYNTYITSYKIQNMSETVNGAKAQGYWGFETNVFGQGYKTAGQAPSGATTVPNPLFNSSPIPSGSCLVTAAFTEPLVITGQETADVVVKVSLSVNKSFEWVEVVNDGWFQPDKGEYPVDMGVRGMIPSRQ